MVKTHRGTISVNDCQVLAHYQFEADQYIITLESKEIADSTRPGQFVHLSVSGMLAMRRPISVMSVDAVFKIMRAFIRVMSLILLGSIWIAFLRVTLKK